MSDVKRSFIETPCCGVVSTKWYIGTDGKQRFICPRCKSVYVVSDSKLVLENDKQVKVKSHE